MEASAGGSRHRPSVSTDATPSSWAPTLARLARGPSHGESKIYSNILNSMMLYVYVYIYIYNVILHHIISHHIISYILI